MAAAVIAVIGAGGAGVDPELLRAAEEVGRRIAAAGATLVCGGLGGVMEAASRGARGAGGQVVGLLPGDDRAQGNEHLSVAIPTGLGELRNVLVVRAADAVVAVGGGYGTLSEVGFALKTGRHVIGLNTWELRRGGTPDRGIIVAATPDEAVAAAVEAARRGMRPPGSGVPSGSGD